VALASCSALQWLLALSICPEGWREKKGARDRSSALPPTPGSGFPISSKLAQGSPVQPPTNIQGAGGSPHGQSSAGYVAGTCPLASRLAARLRGPLAGTAAGPRATPFFSCGTSEATSPSLDSDSSASLRMSFPSWGNRRGRSSEWAELGGGGLEGEELKAV
jgi:hypothetical protein